MAKINHNNVFDTIDGVIENAKNAKSIHLYAADQSFKGDALTIDGKKVWHFANTAYLGLSATFEKRKMGTTIIPKEAYMQSADNYQSDLLQTFY